MQIRYYMTCSRFEALVASHLEPEAFGTYMAVGSTKLSSGHVIFFEIDPAFARYTDYFKIDDIETRCAPHADGSPKRSKYISIYRVMEHICLEHYKTLYLGTADGRVMGIEPSSFTEDQVDHRVHLYHELCPVSPLVVSALSPTRFANFMTNPGNPVHVPRLFFADLLADRDESGCLAGYLPYQDRAHILDCIAEIERGAEKRTKTASRNPVHHGFFRTIRRGFFVGDQTGVKFYRFPDRRVLEVDHAKWWRSASESLA